MQSSRTAYEAGTSLRPRSPRAPRFPPLSRPRYILLLLRGRRDTHHVQCNKAKITYSQYKAFMSLSINSQKPIRCVIAFFAVSFPLPFLLAFCYTATVLPLPPPLPQKQQSSPFKSFPPPSFNIQPVDS